MSLCVLSQLTHSAEGLAVTQGEELAEIFSLLFGEPPATFATKWLRVHGTQESTDMHSDYFFFNGNAQSMLTCWIALGDYTVEDGTLVVCERSHTLSGFCMDKFYESKQELPEAFCETEPSQHMWRTTDFEAGDAVIFDIRLVHASSTNLSDKFRISIDTRWQPSSKVQESNASS